MQRDPRLHGLSSDHHRALVLARRIRQHAGSPAARDLVTSVRRAFDTELGPHFRIEEDILLPALRDAEQSALADRVLADHEAMAGHLVEAERGDPSALQSFAALLEEHVRFEERHLFPACEAHLPDAVLERVAAS